MRSGFTNLGINPVQDIVANPADSTRAQIDLARKFASANQFVNSGARQARLIKNLGQSPYLSCQHRIVRQKLFKSDRICANSSAVVEKPRRLVIGFSREIVDIDGAFYYRKRLENWPEDAGATVGATAAGVR